MLPEEQRLELLTKMLFSESGKTMLKRDQSQVENVCDKCNKVCKTPGGIKRHMKIHSVSDCLRCTICNYVTESDNCFVLHFEKAHLGEASFSCKQCMYRTTNSSYFARHLMVHSGKRYNRLQSRTTLNKKYNSTIRIQPHSKEKLKNCQYLRKRSFANPYACNYCNNTFLQKCSLISHVKSLHSGENMSISSDEPGKAKNFACPRCNYRTASRLCLARHMAAECDEKLHRCVQCNFSSKWKHSLQRHVELKHRGGTKLEALGTVKQYDGYSLVKTKSPKTKKKTRYNCNHCSYKAPNMHRLIHHSMIHSGLRPYKCPSCTYASRWPFCLKSHIRAQHRGEANVPDVLKKTILINKFKAEVLILSTTSKSGAKPFSCNQCSFRAAFKHSLTRHLKSHTRNVLYSCPKCSYASIRKYNVQVHMRSLHKGEKGEPLLYMPSSKASKKGEKMPMSVKLPSGRSKLVKSKSPEAKEKTRYNCNHCNYKAPNMYRLIHHSMIHSGLKPYICPCCPYASRWTDELKRHMKTKHPGEKYVPGLLKNAILINKFKSEVLKLSTTSKSGAKPFYCNQCSFRAAFKHSLTRHLKTHTSSYVSNEKENVRSQMRSLHLVEKYEPLPRTTSLKDRKKFKTRPLVKSSKLAQRRFVCSKCNYRAYGEWSLAHHLMIHSGKKPYKCPYCTHATRWFHGFKKHMKSKHPEKDDIELSRLLRRIEKSIRSQLLNKHLKNKYHLEKLFACSLSNYRASNNLLLDHHSMVHVGETPLKYESELTENLVTHSRPKDSKEEIIRAPSESINLSNNLHKSSLFKTSVVNSGGEKSMTCNLCGFKAKNGAYLTRHTMVHSGVKPYRCEYCTYASGWKCDLQKHVRLKHQRKAIKLDQSEEKREPNNLDESSRIKVREKKHSEENSFSCKKSTYKAELKSHLKSQDLSRNLVIHCVRKVHKCLHCRYVTNKTEQLKNHIELKHSGNKVGVENVNSSERKKDIDESSIDQGPPLHKDTEKKESCPHCNFKTDYSQSLKRHLYIHYEEKHFKCSQCPYASRQSYNLNKHIKKNHRERDVVSRFVHKRSNLIRASHSILETTKQNLKPTENPNSALNSGVSKSHIVGNSGKNPFASNRVDKVDRIEKVGCNKKSYNCPHCTYMSRLPKALQTHIRIQHSGVYFGSHVHSCAYDNCSYKTLEPSHFNTHLLTHTGIKPYQCKKCEKSFTQKGNLNIHMKAKHPSGEEFACGLCSFKTIDFNQLKMHLTTSHDEEES